MRSLALGCAVSLEELDPDDSDVSKWGNINDHRKWISIEDLPSYWKDHY
jgi:hypothetical protein